MKYFIIGLFTFLSISVIAAVVEETPPKSIEQQKFELYKECVSIKVVNNDGNIAECDSIKQ